MALSPADGDAFERCITAGGVAVFPADTVYGLACDPTAADAVRRLYALKRRPPDRPAAVMFFQPSLALAALGELGRRTRDALLALLPGPVTLLLSNPAGRYPLACGPDPATLGLRVPALPAALASLQSVRRPVLQSSANVSGGADARALADVPEEIRAGADLVLDGGPVPGTPSTVVDLRSYEAGGEWAVLRTGALTPVEIGERLGSAP